MIKNAIAMLMDGITDVNMMIDYMYDAETPEEESWIRKHIDSRMEWIWKDYEYVCMRLELKEKARGGDIMAEAFKSHLDHEMSELKRRIG